MGMATVVLPPAVPLVPADLSGGPRSGNVIRFARGINAALRGAISATIQVTLVPGDTKSQFNDTRIGNWSYIGLMPMTAHAVAALPTCWIETTDGSAVIHHANSPNTDATFVACIIGS